MGSNEGWPTMDDKSKAQRAERGWAETDVWSLDCYLAAIIRDAVPLIGAVGHPAYMKEAEWTEVCAKISSGMGAYLEANDFGNDMGSSERTKAEKQGTVAWRLFAKHIGSMWT
jgi:hypothetical protein